MSLNKKKLASCSCKESNTNYNGPVDIFSCTQVRSNALSAKPVVCHAHPDRSSFTLSKTRVMCTIVKKKQDSNMAINHVETLLIFEHKLMINHHR